MTLIGAATKAMFNTIAADTYRRAEKWFREHPDEAFAYWAKDSFLPGSASPRDKLAFEAVHPEIEEIDDHTTVYFDGDTLTLKTFCPRLRIGIRDFYESGYCSGDCWAVEPDPELTGNWIVRCRI